MANLPDLIIGDIALDFTIPQYADVTFSYVVQNTGTAATGISTWAVYAFDKEPVFITGGFAGSESVATLAAGASTTITESFVATMGLGQHTLWIKADTTNKQVESDETNNLKAITFTVTPAIRPDLVVESVTGETSVPQGYDLDFSYVVKNIGVKPIDGTTARYRFDDKPTSSVNSGPGDSVSALAEGASATITSHISTAGLSAGQHTLWIGADAGGSLAEIDEGNNWTPYTFTVTPNLPDLIIESITGPTEVSQGGDLHFSYVLKDANGANIVPAQFSSIIFGIDRQPTSSANDWTVSPDTIPGGGSLTLNEVLVSTHLSVGQHTLWIKADGYNQVAEGNEANNLTSFTFTVTAPVARPDLQLMGITGATSVEQGEVLNLSYLVKNVGSLPSIASHAGYMLGQKADATHYVSATTISALAADQAQWLNAVIDTSNLAPGIHTAYLALDLFGVVTEVTETNNWGGLTFQVTAATRPDLTVDSITANTSVVQGADFNFSYFVKNSGTTTSGSSWSGFRIDQQPDQSNYAGYNLTDAVSVGGYQNLFNSFSTANLSVGTHTLYVMADYWGKRVTETDETNNVRSITFTVTAPPTTDLTVKSLTSAATVAQQGEWIDFAYVIKNAGAATNGAKAAYWIDNGSALGTFNLNLPLFGETASLTGRIDTSALSAGQHTLWVDADYFGNVTESNESNNRTSITFTVTAASRPDLVVRSIAAGSSVMQGRDFSFSYVIENSGVAASGTNWAGIWIDQQPGSGSTAGFNLTNSLSAGASQTLSGTINTAGLTAGQHTLYIASDYWGQQVTESNETNNWNSVTFTVVAPEQPDLVVNTIMAASSVVQGAILDFSFLVQNTGDSLPTATSWAGFRIDSQPDQTHVDGFNFVGTLAGDGSQTLSNSIDTSGLSVGTHTVWIAADYWGQQVAESDETNNLSSFTFTVTARPRPDLVVNSITAAASVMQGTDLSFSYLIANTGDVTSGTSWAGVWIDQQPDSGNASGFNLAAALSAGGTLTLSNKISTTNLGVGEHTLWIAADYWGNQVGESNESNNWRSVTFNVTAPPPPDLDVTGITANASVVRGELFNFSYVVKNIGAGLPSGGNWAGIMIDQQPDAAHYVGFNFVGALAADGTQSLSNSIDTSALSVGTHTLYVAADYWGNQVVEGNETNNWMSVTFDVTAADLEVSSITAGASVMQGLAFNFSYVIGNIGTATAGANWAGVWIDQQPGSGNASGFNQANALSAGGTQTLSNSIDTSSLSVGTHTLWIATDYWANMVGESNEANNWRSVTFDVTAPVQPDLAVNSITAAASVVKGESFDFSYVVKNISAGLPAGMNWAGIWIDQPPGSGNTAGFNLTNALAAGESQTLNGHIDTSQLTVGEHTLHIKADYWGNMVAEGNEANNSLSVPFTVTDLFS